MNKTYSELIKLPTFEERFKYLKISGIIGEETFGSNRYLNQAFYSSYEWKRFRREVIIRDNGMDLGVNGYDIHGIIVIHHINPISIEDIANINLDVLMNFDNVISTSERTHKAIHYSDDKIVLRTEPIIRKPNDTCLWK